MNLRALVCTYVLIATTPLSVYANNDQHFDQCVRNSGPSYVAARDAFVAASKTASILEIKENSDDWNVRATAYILRAWREHEVLYRNFKNFFDRHKLQPAIDLHTNWLAVGHVDEVISFIPKADGNGAIMLLSSPALAFDIIRKLPKNTPLDPKYELEFGLRNIGDFFNWGTLQRTLEAYNLEVDRLIFGTNHASPSPNSIKGILIRELGWNASDKEILEVTMKCTLLVLIL